MPSEFEIDTTARRIDDDTFELDLSDGWRIGGGLNGGYLLATLGRAIGQAAGERYPHPFILSAHYLSAARPGPATIRTQVIRRGGSLATVEARLVQDHEGEERIRLMALASYGDLHGLTDDVRTTAQPPALPPREQCLPTSMAPADFKASAPFLDRFELLGDPATLGWAWGEPSGEGEIQGWFRLPDHEPDPFALLLAVDALPPVTFALGMPGWAPTHELTVHLRALPASGWLRVRHATRNLAGGYFEEDCEVWDEAGRLVAQSRQLAGAPRG